ncbi:MAG: SURF1 family protein [Acidimicrobiales bacterium]
MSWRFALTPKWIVRHAMVAALIASMIALGLWQLRRLDEKQTYKALVESRQEQPIDEITRVVPRTDAVDDVRVTEVLYRRVRATGTYMTKDTVVVENRTFNAAPGAWVLTPLRLKDGSAVVVNRGFIGYGRAGLIVPPAPPGGQVTVEGFVFPSQARGRFGPTDPTEGRLEVLARVELGRYAAQLDYDILPAYVQLVSSQPAEPPVAAGVPELVALGPPDPDDGPHLSYAVQWGIFTAIASGGYVLVLRRVARDEAKLRTGGQEGSGSG